MMGASQTRKVDNELGINRFITTSIGGENGSFNERRAVRWWSWASRWREGEEKESEFARVEGTGWRQGGHHHSSFRCLLNGKEGRRRNLLLHWTPISRADWKRSSAECVWHHIRPSNIFPAISPSSRVVRLLRWLPRPSHFSSSPPSLHTQTEQERKKENLSSKGFPAEWKDLPPLDSFRSHNGPPRWLGWQKKKKTVGLQAPFIQVYLGAARPAAAANNNKCKRVEETGFVHPTKAALRGSAQSARQLCRADDRASRRDGRFSFLFFFFYYDSFAV